MNKKMNNETEQIFLLNSTESQTVTAQKINETPETAQVNLENVEDFSNVCRTCATITEFVIPIFDGEGLQNNLADKIHKHLPIQVSEQDLLPRVVCYQCASTLLAWHELVQCCVQADAALRTRLAVNVELADQEQLTSSNEASQNLEKEPKFKEIAEFVVQSMDPPHYVDDSTSPAIEPSRTCDYCSTDHAERAYKEHLVTAHADLLFHCDECDTYVDRKDFLLHMSLHAVQYTNNHEKKTESAKKTKRPKKKKIEEKDEIESNEKNAQKCSDTTSRESDVTAEQVKTDAERQTDKRGHTTSGVNVNETHQNEFSDQSDIEYGFGPLPESVFEAIEDSQDGRPVDETEARSPRTSEINDDIAPDERDGEPSAVTPPPAPHPRPPPPRSDDEKDKQKKSRTCPICSKVYAASSSYFYHMKYFHKRSKEHECEVCGKKFGTKGGLAQHATIHTGECRLECKECGKKFRSKASLYIHEQTHNGIKSWSCAQCHRCFRWRTHLARHMKRHSAEKSHACATCGRGFSVRCDLLRHARTHRAGQFACDKCGLKFAQLRYLKVHVDKKHSPPVAAHTAHAAATSATVCDKNDDTPTKQCA